MKKESYKGHELTDLLPLAGMVIRAHIKVAEMDSVGLETDDLDGWSQSVQAAADKFEIDADRLTAAVKMKLKLMAS